MVNEDEKEKPVKTFCCVLLILATLPENFFRVKYERRETNLVSGHTYAQDLT